MFLFVFFVSIFVDFHDHRFPFGSIREGHSRLGHPRARETLVNERNLSKTLLPNLFLDLQRQRGNAIQTEKQGAQAFLGQRSAGVFVSDVLFPVFLPSIRADKSRTPHAMRFPFEPPFLVSIRPDTSRTPHAMEFPIDFPFLPSIREDLRGRLGHPRAREVGK